MRARERPSASAGRHLELRRGDVRLAVADFGGSGPGTLLVHGLAGRAQEWHYTAEWLTAESRVIAVDLRGHGLSERHPVDRSPAALVDDLAFCIERLELGRVVVVGQSMAPRPQVKALGRASRPVAAAHALRFNRRPSIRPLQR